MLSNVEIEKLIGERDVATLTARNAELVEALKPFVCDCSKEGFGRCERAEWMSPSTACAWFTARRILEASK